MRLSKKMLWVLSLSIVGLSVLSCDRESKYKPTEHIYATAQVRSFGIKSESNKSLEQYIFSVDNTGEVGVISNQRPLPYGTELTDVTLPIQLLQQGNITVSIGTAQPVEWTAEKKFTISTGAEVMLHITNTVDWKNSNAQYKYSYRVKINQFGYDPESISWQKVYSQDGTNVLAGDGQGFVFVNPKDGGHYLAQRGSDMFYRLSGAQMPQAVAFAGLQQGDKIKRIAQEGQDVYALGISGRLYHLGSNNAWTVLPGAEQVSELLGILPAYGAGAKPQLALLLGDAGEGYRYAVYHDGVTVQGNKATAKFPGQSEGDRFFALGTTAEYEGATLKLIATTAADEAGKSYRSVWFTSNGTAWAKESETLVDSPTPEVFQAAFAHNTYYRLEQNQHSVSIYESANQSVWTLSKDVALTGLSVAELASSNSLMWSEGGMLYILSVGEREQLSIWQGEILKTKLNR